MWIASLSWEYKCMCRNSWLNHGKADSQWKIKVSLWTDYWTGWTVSHTNHCRIKSKISENAKRSINAIKKTILKNTTREKLLKLFYIFIMNYVFLFISDSLILKIGIL